jgi:hypothetical protein
MGAVISELLSVGEILAGYCRKLCGISSKSNARTTQVPRKIHSDIPDDHWESGQFHAPNSKFPMPAIGEPNWHLHIDGGCFICGAFVLGFQESIVYFFHVQPLAEAPRERIADTHNLNQQVHGYEEA